MANRILDANTGLRPGQSALQALNIALSAGNQAEHMTVGSHKKVLGSRAQHEARKGKQMRSNGGKGFTSSGSAVGKDNKPPVGATVPLRSQSALESSDDEDMPISKWKRAMLQRKQAPVSGNAVAEREDAASALMELSLPR